MTFSKTRVLAVATAVAALFPLLLAAPASAADAASPTCHLLLAGPTPSVEVDTNEDGNPEVRVPSLTNVSVCLGADVVLTETPTIDSAPCGAFPSCMAFHIGIGLRGYVDTDVLFCYTADGSQTCGTTTFEPIPFEPMESRRICVGYDFGGGSPCSNGQLIAFE